MSERIEQIVELTGDDGSDSAALGDGNVAEDQLLFVTQGGGTVRVDDCQPDVWVFVDPPRSCPELRAGDVMPEEWGIEGPINGGGSRG
ncbi:hypothetical protein CMI37_16215 [Candidatus Pacearchaeota archaeon]|nr:hypothetical protein [Candidatus Pacearchaeota archaeon]|tara:strand:+ start:157 stop:420 length:264 start_codon:yes stop_codon:yes gene_type:complete